jgi:hypothetical protein
MRRIGGGLLIAFVLVAGALAGGAGCDRDDTRSPSQPPAAPAPPPPAPQTPPQA